MASTDDRYPILSALLNILSALLGDGRAGKILALSLFMLVVPALGFWGILLPRWRFHDVDEELFRAARHGDVMRMEKALGAGAGVNAAAPLDGKTALFRAAVFGHADAVRFLLAHGADPGFRGNDRRTALEVALAAVADEKDRDRVMALDAVVAVLRQEGRTR